MDIWIPFNEFKRLIKFGQYSPPIFESKGALLVSCGANTIIALKPKPDRVYPNTKTVHSSYTMLKLGYYGLATSEEHLISDEATAEMLLDLMRFLTPEARLGLVARVKEIEEEEKEDSEKEKKW
jgi:hypothetical protein